MSKKVRVMYYLNQFFAGMGGEDKAGVPLKSLEGVVGPGRRFQALIGDSAEIVITVYCGDNYFNEHRDEVLASILKIAQDNNVKMVVAGPSFAAGRYGFACVEVCHAMSISLGLYGLTGLSVENPALAQYKQYKDMNVFAFPTSEDVTGMEEALSRMASFVSKLATGSAIGPASDEGYIPRGIRHHTVVSKSGAERAIDMLLDKIASRPFTTEIIPSKAFFEEFSAAPPITNLKKAHLALAATVGVHSEGNPYGFKAFHNTQWQKYPIGNLDSMKDARWAVVHGGLFHTFMVDNANYGVPLDVCREMEREGVFAKLNPNFYSTTGNCAEVAAMKAIGREMALDMKSEGVDGVILVST